MSKHFTPEEIEELKANPYTAYVTIDSLRHTLAFKKYAVRAYELGKKPREIYKTAGYDPDVLGVTRMSGALRNFREQAKSPKGLQPDPVEKRVSELQSKGKSMKDLQKRIEYLEDEVELLKKSLELKLKYLNRD